VNAVGALPDRIPEILDRVDLVAEIERYTGIRGRRDGVRLAWLCPLPGHETDSDPSFKATINPPLFKCFGCGRGGNVITLIALMESISTSEAIEQLAARVGLDQAPPSRPRTSARSAERREPDWAGQLDGWTAKCHNALVSGRPGHVWAYMRQRGVTSDDVRRWRLGFGLDTGPRALRALRGRLVIPCPGGVEARVIPGYEDHCATPNARYLRPAGDPSRPWGIDRLDPARGPVVLVEGVLDGMALERADVQALALRGKTLRPLDGAVLRSLGFTRAYVGLDRDVGLEPAQKLNEALAQVGVRPTWVVGPTEGDWGNLLARPMDELVEAVVAGMATA
jgi:hypothetical protein